MIGIIGYQDDVIGFGLTGIGTMVEMKPSANRDDVLQAIEILRPHVKTIIINESLYKKIKKEPLTQDIFFIEIPEDLQHTNLDMIEKLTKETLGIAVKE